jgi:hypothetical protein
MAGEYERICGGLPQFKNQKSSIIKAGRALASLFDNDEVPTAWTE